MKKAYHYLFYQLNNIGKYLSDDVLNDVKPYVTITLLEILIGIEILVWYSVFTKKIIMFSNPLYAILPIVSFLALFNYFFFLQNSKWKLYVEEFKSYNQSKRRVNNLFVFLFITIIIVSLIFSFYKLSQVDWKLYR